MKIWFRKNMSFLGILFLMLAISILSISLLFKLNNSILTIIGCSFSTFGIIFTLYDHDNKPKRGFEMVNKNMRKQKYFHMPTRGTKFSAGYDFYSPEEYIVKPNEIVKIWTDVKAYMRDNEFLMLDVRSSLGGKFMLANTIGIIDSDYYGNSDNDGNICLILKNISNQTQIIQKESRIAQGIFMEYLRTDKDSFIYTERSGGFGSSDNKQTK